MSPKHKERFYMIFVICFGLSLATGLILYALRQNINVFYTPSEIAAGEVPLEQNIRIGGMVVEGSFQRFDKLKVKFTLTDYAHNVDVYFDGILPDLFREGQGIVTEGQLHSSSFEANMVLAKHDENYMPKELRDSLKSVS